jgi:hypothetical protein
VASGPLRAVGKVSGNLLEWFSECKSPEDRLKFSQELLDRTIRKHGSGDKQAAMARDNVGFAIGRAR